MSDDLKTASSLTEMDQLRLRAATEKQARLELQFQLLQAQAEKLQKEIQAAQGTRNAVVTDIRTRYELSDQDSVDLETGALTRQPKAVEEPAPKAKKKG